MPQYAGARNEMKPITIFHTSDLHNVLRPAAAEQLTALKRDHPGSLLFDSGDAVKAGNLGFSPTGEPTLRRMAEVGYEAMAMGNRESHPLHLPLAQKLKDATFPVLSANLLAQREAPPEMVKPYVIFARAGRRLAVFGLTPQMTRPASAWARVTSFVFADPVQTARTLAPELKREADLVICLSHCGYKVDAILAEVPGIDLVLGGHSHKLFVQQEGGKAMVVHPGKFGSHVSHTELEDREHVTSELLALEQGT
jgi:2',3'-cyclic-nucleotide 2'-phosphodiesterase (5'-nucleotidase family)